MPCGSLIRTAYSRQGCRTEHVSQIDFARASRSSFSSLRSKCDGGKKTTAWGPRQAAFTCQISSVRSALTSPPFPLRRPYCQHFWPFKGELSRAFCSRKRCAASALLRRIAVVARCALQRFDFQYEAFDG